jgi:serine/threonine-protein kinase
VASNKVQHNIDVMGETTRIDALADSVSLQLLRALGGDGLAGGARIASLGTSSITALKSYLVGQQYYRRGLIDSTLMAFEAAVAADSLFSLAWRGVASVYIRTGREAMPEARAALDRAIRLRRAGSPRDSLLFHGDSLRLALGRRAPASNDPISEVPEASALLATLTEATRRYPSDAELWMELGDAGFHYGYLINRPDSVVLQEFTRAIALDSMMLVPYVHAQTLAVRLAKYREAATFSRRLRVLSAAQVQPYYTMYAEVMDSAPSLSAVARAHLDTMPPQYVGGLLRDLVGVPEATPLSLAVLGTQITRLAKNPNLPEAAGYSRLLGLQQAQLGKSVTAPQALAIGDRAQMAVAGLLPVEPLLAEAVPYLTRQPIALSGMLSLYASSRDTGAVRTIAKVFDSVDVAVRSQGNPAAAHRGDVSRAYLLLAQGDSAAALRAFLAVPMATCGDTPCASGVLARLLANAGRHADAARVLDRAWSSVRTSPSGAPLMLLRAELAERLNDTPAARVWFSRVIAQWGSGDAPTQSTVTAARAGLRRLP